MTYKTFEDNAPTYVFKYVFTDSDTAQVGSVALHGFMVGTYDQVAMESTISRHGNGMELVARYTADRPLTKEFKRICDSFKDYYKGEPEEDEDDERPIMQVVRGKTE